MRWPWQKAKSKPRYNYFTTLEQPWRRFWFSPTAWCSMGETCQCEPVAGGWDRTACHIHGPNGRELYDTLKEENTRYDR